MFMREHINGKAIVKANAANEQFEESGKLGLEIRQWLSCVPPEHPTGITSNEG